MPLIMEKSHFYIKCNSFLSWLFTCKYEIFLSFILFYYLVEMFFHTEN